MKEYYQKNKKIKDVEFEEVFGQAEKKELRESYKQSLANKKEREQKENEELNIANSERFINYERQREEAQPE